jgi:uncharacterized membrane protein YidH (DUF202 family)
VNHQTASPDVVAQQLDRTSMARLRTQLALDRTTLAWIRTALTMATFGFAMGAFFRTLRERSPSAEAIHLDEGAIAFGTALVILGTVATVLAGIAHWLTLRRLRRGGGLFAPMVSKHYRGHAIGRDRLGVALASTPTVSGVRSFRVGVLS